MDTLECIVQEGADDAPVIVLLHGRGSDERDVHPLGRALHPSATIVSVRAPFAAAQWGYGPGWAWYRFLHGTTPEPGSFEAGQDALLNFIAHELPRRVGTRSVPPVLGGFSQGGTSSLAFASRNPESVAAVLVFSGFLANHPSVSAVTLKPVPVWWGHGTADSAIPFAHANTGWQALLAADVKLTPLTRPGLGHSIDSTELESAREWVARLGARADNTNPDR